jgi:two-component system, OmpR family, response regulator MprA
MRMASKVIRPPEAPTTALSLSMRHIEIDGRQPRVLVVDDDANVRASLIDLLTGWGCAVAEAGDGAAAWAVLAGFQPDVILLDLIMPRAEVDGFSFLGRLGESTVPVLVMSTLGLAPGEAFGRHVAAVLEKPLSADTLLREIRRLLASSERTR